jgi:hypothetical protein
MKLFKLNPNRPILLFAVTIVCFMANLIGWYPGESNYDSDLQYAEAVSGNFTDVQPPIMAWLWSGLRLIVDGSGLLFAFHIVCYWLGFGLIAGALHNTGRTRAAWAVIAIGLLPPVLMTNSAISKDVGLATTFLASFAIFFWYRIKNVKVNRAAAIIAILLLLYGSLVRANAVFALPPLLFYIAYPALLSHPLKFIMGCAMVAILTIPLANTINHDLLRAEPTNRLLQLQIFDLAGIAHFSNDEAVFGGGRVTKQLISDCYTPVLQDPLGDGNCAILSTLVQPNATKMWLDAIARHPIAYAQHRIAHLGYEFSAVLLRHHAVDAMYNWMAFVDVAPTTWKERIIDYVRYDAVFSPWFFLVSGSVVLILVAPKSEDGLSSLKLAAFSLAISGLFYMLAYLIAGIASDFRYQYWGMISTFTASVLCVSERRNDFTWPLSRVGKACAGFLLLALVVIQTTQMIERHAVPAGVDLRTRQPLVQP